MTPSPVDVAGLEEVLIYVLEYVYSCNAMFTEMATRCVGYSY